MGLSRLSSWSSRLRWPRGLLLGLLCALLMAGALRLGWLNHLEGNALDLLFQARGTRFPDPRITILVVDDATVAQVGKWPLPRRVYADVLRRLDRAGVRTIVFDVLFSVPASSSSSDDADFAQACRESKRVVQAAVFHVPQLYNLALPASLTSDKRTPPARFGVTDLGAQHLNATWISSALPPLQASAVAMGHVNVYPEIDGTLRRVPLIRYRNQLYPSLALVGAAHFLGLSPRDIRARKDWVEMFPAQSETRRIPLDERGETWVNWIGGNDSFPTYNFNQLIEGRVPEVALKDRIVLIGVTAAGAYEGRATPFSPVQPAIELQANAVDDILSNRPLREAAPWARYAVLFAACLLAGLLIAPRRAFAGFIWVLVLNAVLWKSAVWGMDAQDLYMPIATPLLSVVLIYGVATAFNYRREWETNWRVDAAVTALARGSALMASGRDREALLRDIRRTAREVLQAREVFLVLPDSATESPPESSTEIVAAPQTSPAALPSLKEVARHIFEKGQIVLWPARSEKARVLQQPTLPTRRSRKKQADKNIAKTEVSLASLSPTFESLLNRLNSEVQQAHQRLRAKPSRDFKSIVAAPLHQTTGDVSEDAPNLPSAVLLAAGRRDGQTFTSRDAVLLATLADQATLALGNLEYYEMLRGRIDLANRDLRQAYQTLAEERTKLAAAMESNEGALIISDEANRAVFINSTSHLLVPQATLGQSVPDALDKHGLREFTQLFEPPQEGDPTPLKTTAEITRFLERGPQHDPARSILSAQLTTLVSSEGRRLGTMLVITDVTTQRDLGQMKDDFVSYVAHELRSPLSAINGYAFLLKSGTLNFNSDQRQEMLVSIEDQCNRLNRMVNDLLDISGIESAQDVQLTTTQIDLATLCDKVMNDQRATLSSKAGISLELHCPQRPLFLEADADRLEQILINLLSNAIKYSPDGGIVTVSLLQDPTAEAINISVADTGMGMTPEQLSKLFQKYYRAPDAQMRGIKGTGLGLHLVKRLVEAHSGRIEVKSEYREGTTFTVTLPVEAVDEGGAINSNEDI